MKKSRQQTTEAYNDQRLKQWSPKEVDYYPVNHLNTSKVRYLEEAFEILEEDEDHFSHQNQ